MSSMVIRFVAFFTVYSAFAQFDCPDGKLNKDQRESTLRKHNELRSSLATGQEKDRKGNQMPIAKNMLRMGWSCNLEYSAQQWADRCVFEHAPWNVRQGGENLYMMSSVEKDVVQNGGLDAGDLWWSELQKNYSIKDNPYNIITGEKSIKDIGHWSQMAWADSYQLGCGIAACNNSWTFVVCRYKPSGNHFDSKIYEFGKPCESCSNGCDNATKLCLPKEEAKKN